MQRIAMQSLIDFGTRLLTTKGVAEADARYLAEMAVTAEAFGVTTHGLVQFGYFCSQFGKTIDPAAAPVIVKQKGASALIDGNGTFGQLALKLAKQLGVEKARSHGVALIGVARTSWIAAMGVHLISLAQEGFLAQIWAQNCACQDCAPFGGIDPRFSTNPIALAFPADGDPVIADFSTAATSMGRVSRLVKQGKKADSPIFMDSEGRITDDPTVVRGREGDPPGSILFMGGAREGYKGYALSLWCEAMTAMVGADCNNPEAPQRQSFTLTVIDPEAFAGREYYQKEMKRFIAWVKSSRVREGFDEIRLPGERGFRLLREAQKDGVPVEDSMLSRLNELAEANGIEPIAAARL